MVGTSRNVGRGGGGRGKGHQHHSQHGRGQWPRLPGHRKKHATADTDKSSDIIVQFQQHARELDERNDKFERIVKLSRDITIESKRIIFLLHRITCDSDKPSVLSEAENRFSQVRFRFWRPIALETQTEAPYKYLRAYTNGLQEYIEAVSFYHFLLHGTLISFNELQDQLKFDIDGNKKREKPGKDVATINSSQSPESKNIFQRDEELGGKRTRVDTSSEAKNGMNDTGNPVVIQTNDSANECDKGALTQRRMPEKISLAEKEGKIESPDVATVEDPMRNIVESRDKDESVTVLVPHGDFILGLADLTGEVMRQAINMVANGEIHVCFDLLHFLQAIHEGFLAADCYPISKEMGKKISTLRQSLRKVENACYAINIRGLEVPKHLLSTYFKADEEAGNSNDMDEAFYED